MCNCLRYTKEEVKKLIVQEVETVMGTKRSNLLSRENLIIFWSNFNLVKLTEELVKENRIKEVKFIIDGLFRDSFLLPHKSEIV